MADSYISACFESVFSAHQERLWKLAFWLLTPRVKGYADDAVQESLLRYACEVCPKCLTAPGRYTCLTSPDTAKRELDRMLLIRIKNINRWSWLRRTRLGPALEPPDPDEGPCRAAEKEEAARMIQEALGRIDDNERKAIVLVDIQGYSYADAADRLGVPLGTLKTWLHRGRMHLGAELGDEH